MSFSAVAAPALMALKQTKTFRDQLQEQLWGLVTMFSIPVQVRADGLLAEKLFGPCTVVISPVQSLAIPELFRNQESLQHQRGGEAKCTSDCSRSSYSTILDQQRCAPVHEQTTCPEAGDAGSSSTAVAAECLLGQLGFHAPALCNPLLAKDFRTQTPKQGVSRTYRRSLASDTWALALPCTGHTSCPPASIWHWGALVMLLLLLQLDPCPH